MSVVVPPHGWLCDYVALYAPLGEAAEEAHLGAAIAALSAAIGWKGWLQFGESTEPVTLFVILEGQSATARKTSTTRTASEIVRLAMADTPPGVVPALRVERAQHVSQAGLIEMVGPTDPDLARRYDEIPPPAVVIEWDEFGSLLGDPRDLKGSGWLGQVRAALMAMYGGRHGGIRTRSAGIPASRCAVSVIATMTRVELERRAELGILRDGFLGRFVLVPNPGRRAIIPRPRTMTDEERARRQQIISFLRSVAKSGAILGNVYDRLSPAAGELFDHWYTTRLKELEARAETGGEAAAAVSEAFNRLQASAMKVAAVVAVSQMPVGTDLDSVQIGVDHVEYGISFAERGIAEVSSLADTGGDTQADQYARKVLEYLSRRNGHGPVPRKELMDAVRHTGMNSGQRWKVVETMHAEGRVHVEVEQTTRRPRQIVGLPS